MPDFKREGAEDHGAGVACSRAQDASLEEQSLLLPPLLLPLLSCLRPRQWRQAPAVLTPATTERTRARPFARWERLACLAAGSTGKKDLWGQGSESHSEVNEDSPSPQPQEI